MMLFGWRIMQSVWQTQQSLGTYTGERNWRGRELNVGLGNHRREILQASSEGNATTSVQQPGKTTQS